jgi:hypothetical protein
MAEWYHQRWNKINLRSEATIVTALRHVVTLFSVTVSYPKSSAYFVPESDHGCAAYRKHSHNRTSKCRIARKCEYHTGAGGPTPLPEEIELPRERQPFLIGSSRGTEMRTSSLLVKSQS